MQSWELNRSVPSVIRAHVFNHVYTTLVGKGDTQTEVDCLQKRQQELRLARLWEGSEGKEPGNERKGEIERRGSREKWRQLKRAVISKGIHQAIETNSKAKLLWIPFESLCCIGLWYPSHYPQTFRSQPSVHGTFRQKGSKLVQYQQRGNREWQTQEQRMMVKDNRTVVTIGVAPTDQRM